MIPADYVIGFVVIGILVYSVVLHEIAHAVVADWCGDPTSRRLGRITLDPIPHIDPVMTIALPLVLYIVSSGNMVFGGAKPVPINPMNFRQPKRDMMLVAIAGPITNVLIAVVLALLINTVPLFGYFNDHAPQLALRIIAQSVMLNFVLAVFNMIPIPPLDGSKVLAAFMPNRLAYSYLSIPSSTGILLVMGLVVLGGVRYIAPVAISATDILLRTVNFMS
ncbi:Peptidase family M50 [Planctomycetes bacterium Pan216]|uniref:Peptidase family M50 n=1 Tax=Kolteria novifilia TaxID=2527975 RepID=A0A518B7B4_9BACT|nr:Peptidase family M50 [Planctomycetes bacterium Pan216]